MELDTRHQHGWLLFEMPYNSNAQEFEVDFLLSGQINTWFWGYNPFPRFEKDNIYFETETHFLLLDGIIFNKHELMQHQSGSWAQIVLSLFVDDLTKGIDRLRGSFNGFFIDKESSSCFCFTNQTGERAVFYYSGTSRIASSNFNLIFSHLRNGHIPYSLSLLAAQRMLSYGSMLDDTTFFNEVKRLLPGHIIELGNIETPFWYHKFSNTTPAQYTKQEAIDKIDILFRKAVQREFEKDQEYGYTSVVDISGGMDCRMVAFVAKAMGYTNQINISYSQTQSNEFKITKRLSNILGFEFIHYPLDDVSFMMQPEDIIKNNYGLVYYYSITGGRNLLKVLSSQRKLGIEHTGLCGDVYDGSMATHPYHTPPGISKWYKIGKQNKYDVDTETLRKYPNFEMSSFYMYWLLTGLGSHFVRRPFCETYSPFCDVDFLDFVFTIPLEMKVKGHIFRKWANQKYPEACSIPNESTMCKVNVPDWIAQSSRGFRYFWNNPIKKLLYQLHLSKTKNSPNSMNPIEYWYETNKTFQNYVDSYSTKNQVLINSVPAIRQTLDGYFGNGSLREKLLAITVCTVLKTYFYE